MAILIITYLFYCLVAWWVYVERADKILYQNGKTGNLSIWNLRHLAGIALLFICPVFVSADLFRLFGVGMYSFFVIIAIVAVGYGLFNLSIIRGFNLPPAVSKPRGGRQNYWVSILLRAAFLACYEFYFRGLLLFTFAGVIGFFYASFISTALYALSHFGDNRKELIVTVPFGFFLCWVTMKTNSILPAIMLHWCVALPGEIIVLKKIVPPHN